MDDLAAVLGHEIAHVAARHSAAQISKMQLLNYGLFGIAVATGGATQKYGQLIDLGAVLSFSKFSRDHEREADHFGTRYMVKSGYNPNAAIDVMEQIQRLQTQEPSTLDVWFMTHPPTKERIENLTEEINLLSSDEPQVLDRPHQRNKFITLLDGMAVGQWNGKELVKGNRYYNKEFLFSMPIPPEWEVQINNKNATAIFFNTRQEAFSIIDIQPLQKKMSTASYFKERAAQLKRQGFVAAPPPEDIPKYPHGAMVGIFQSKRNNAKLIAFVHGDSGFSILGIGPTDKSDVLFPQFDNMIQDFKFLTEEKASKLAPPRLRIHKVASDDTWQKLAVKYFNDTGSKEKLAEYNGFSSDTTPTPGILLKIPPSLRFR
jgi:predicted Zn-dependent protease